MHADGQQAPLLQRLEWIKSSLELVLLLLAIPWLIISLYKSPGGFLRGLGKGHLG
jgi:hypothetical protein